MAKSPGLGDNLYIAGYDLSGDVGSVDRIADSGAMFEVPGIDKSAMERIPGLADGGIDFTAYFNDASSAAHPVLKTRGSGDKIVTYSRGTTLGNAGAGLVGKQVDYAPTRGADGSLTIGVQVQGSDGDGLRWGRQLTAGKRTDTAATNGASVDHAAASAFGLVAYLHVFAFTGTDVTITLQDSANNSAFLAITGGAFTAVTAGPTSERILTATDAAVRRYIRVATSTTGGFTSVTFAVLLARRFATF